MNTTSKYSVSDAALLYKKSRATLYKDIKNGILSRDHDGRIDFSELLRVYGEPFNKKDKKRIEVSSLQILDTPEYNEKTVIELKNQIDFLKKQLEKAEDREAKANARIDTLLTLIEMKPTKNNESTSTDQNTIFNNSNEDLEPPQTEEVGRVIVQEKAQTVLVNVPKSTEPTRRKRGLLKRLTTAFFEN